jgi:hypothetical protein
MKRNSDSSEIEDTDYMKKSLTLLMAVMPALLSAPLAIAQNVATNAPGDAGATTIYRQVMPDGRIVYSDTPTKGVKIDRILSIPATATKSASRPVAGERMRGAGSTDGSGDSGR